MSMRYSNEPPLNAVVNHIPPTNLVLTNEVKIYVCMVQDLLSLLLQSIIFPDCFNRSGILDGDKFYGYVDDSMVREVENNFLPMSLKKLSATVSNNGKFEMTDFHCEAMGIMRRWWSGKMTAADLKVETCIHIKPKEYHKTDYHAINNQRKHAAWQEIWHPQYFYGSFIHNELLPLMPPSVVHWLLNNRGFGTRLSDILFALNRKLRGTDGWNLPNINGMRTEARKMRTESAEMKIKEKDTLDLTLALEGWHDLDKVLATTAQGVGGIGDVMGVAFFALYVVDKMDKEQELAKSNSVLSRQIVRNIGELSVLCSQLLAPKKSTVMNNCQEVVRILKKKRGR